MVRLQADPLLVPPTGKLLNNLDSSQYLQYLLKITSQTNYLGRFFRIKSDFFHL